MNIVLGGDRLVDFCTAVKRIRSNSRSLRKGIRVLGNRSREFVRINGESSIEVMRRMKRPMTFRDCKEELTVLVAPGKRLEVLQYCTRPG